jgi:hypothetical protein
MTIDTVVSEGSDHNMLLLTLKIALSPTSHALFQWGR